MSARDRFIGQTLPFRLTRTGTTGAAVDLSGGTVTLRMQTSNGTISTLQTQFVTNGADGLATVNYTPLLSGSYQYQWKTISATGIVWYSDMLSFRVRVPL